MQLAQWRYGAFGNGFLWAANAARPPQDEKKPDTPIHPREEANLPMRKAA